MKRIILGVVLASFMTPLGAQQANQEPTDADWEWYARYRDRALERLMPMDDIALVRYRSYHDLDHDVAERYFRIEWNHGGVFDSTKLSATVVTPIGSSIQGQLLRLHMANRSASFDAVLSKITVRRSTVETPTCAPLLTQMDGLVDVRISLPRRDLLYLPMHRVWHHVIVQFFDEIDVKLGNPESALARWATTTTDMLLKCAGQDD